METEDKKEFAKIVFAMAENFGATPSEYLLEMWARLFDDDGITIDQIRDAARAILKSREYRSMPTYAEFRSHIVGTADDMAMIQADLVVNAIRHNGYNWQPYFLDPVTQHLVEKKWNWSRLCGTLREEQTPFFIRDFVAAYKTYSKKGLTLIALPSPEGKVKQLTEGIGNITKTG
jgi:hypothetical protein